VTPTGVSAKIVETADDGHKSLLSLRLVEGERPGVDRINKIVVF